MLMLGKYARRVRRLGSDARAALAEDLELHLPARGGLVRAIDGAGLCSADVVLVLLRRGMLPAASMVAGSPVRRYRPHLPLHPPRAAKVYPRRGDDRLITAVTRPCPTKAETDAADRYGLLRRRMTLRAALARGVRRRDLRYWTQQGWIDVEEEPT